MIRVLFILGLSLICPVGRMKVVLTIKIDRRSVDLLVICFRPTDFNNELPSNRVW